MWYGFPRVDDLLLELVQEGVILLRVGLVVLSVLLFFLALELVVGRWL